MADVNLCKYLTGVSGFYLPLRLLPGKLNIVTVEKGSFNEVLKKEFSKVKK